MSDENESTESRAERRRKARAAELEREEEMDKRLNEPKLPSFEAPASGKIKPDPSRKKP